MQYLTWVGRQVGQKYPKTSDVISECYLVDNHQISTFRDFNDWSHFSFDKNNELTSPHQVFLIQNLVTKV